MNGRREVFILGLQKKEGRLRVSIIAIAIILLLFSVVMVWGTSSSWGKVKMQRINFTYATEDSGYTGSAIIMTPKTADKEHKVPGVIIYGGISSYSYSLKSYGIELSRRGYCVILCDMPGQGFSNAIGHNGGYQSYAPGVGADVTSYTETVVGYLQNLNYVDQDNLTVAGFSAGQGWAANTAAWNPRVFKTTMTLSGYQQKNQKIAQEAGVNYVGIKGDGLTSPASCPDYETIPGQFTGSGSFEDRTAIYCYLDEKVVQHQMQPINGGLIKGIIEVFQLSSPTDTTLPSSNLVFMGAEIWSAVAIISLFVLLTGFLQALLTMDYFKSIFHPAIPQYTVMCGGDQDPKKRKIKSIAFLSFRILLVIVLYEIFAARTQLIPLFTGIRPAGLWINVWVPFFIANMVVNVLIFAVWHRKYGKPEGGTAYHYGLVWENRDKNIKNIGKCLLLGAILVFFTLSFLSFLDTLLAINLKVMIFGMITFNLEHMLQMPAYILLYFALLFCPT